MFRHVLRRMFFAATVLSAVGLVFTIVLWPISYYRSVGLEYVTPAGTVINGEGTSGMMWISAGSTRQPAGIRILSGKLIVAREEDRFSGWSYATWRPLTRD